MASDIDDDFADNGDLVSIELFEGIANAINNCVDSVKVGETAMFYFIDGVTPPLDPTIWQECDGSLITDPNSPLVGQTTDDMRDRYLVGAADLGQIGNMAGSNTKDLRHDHTGFTQTIGTGGNLGDASSGAYSYLNNHRHTVNDDMSSTQDFQPAHFTIKHFLKIR